jgi:hypothetical protein
VTYNLSVEERFWSKVNKNGPIMPNMKTRCWVWTAGLWGGGYGCFYPRPELGTIPAHRFVWELHKGPIPEGLYACHKCDNPACVRPGHLFLGTQKDNAEDREAKGRGNHAVIGSFNGSAKLTERLAVKAIEMYSTGKFTHKKIAERLGVSESAIRNIIHGITWWRATGVQHGI